MTDEQCLQSFLEGQEKAFAILYERYRLRIYRYCMRFLDFDTDAGGDAMQDVFVKIYEHAEQFRYTGSVQAWIMTIARNTCRNAVRGSARIVRIDDMNDIIEADPVTNPDIILERRRIAGDLASAFDRLPENQREAILLRTCEEYSYDDIARITGTNIGIVRQRIWRARQALRKMLYNDKPDEPAPGRGGRS
jgi:RNA polymerase sigma-70 factor, ECF subfamily